MQLLTVGMILLCCLSQNLKAISITGNTKAYLIGTQQKGDSSAATQNIFSIISARVSGSDEFADGFSYEWAYELQGSKQSLVATATEAQIAAGDYRMNNHEIVFQSNDGRKRLSQNIDRLLLSYTTEKSRLLVGRQAIWFGVGRIANPTDIFVPFPFAQINPEYRLGIDAIKFTYSLGDLSEAEVGYVVGEDQSSDRDAFFARTKIAWYSWDMELIGIEFLSAQLLGLNLQTNLWGIGFFAEAAQVNPQNEAPYLRWNGGGSYMFANEWLVNFEFHYNGAGEKSTAEYSENYSKFAYLYGGIHYLAKEYASLGARKAIHPLWNLSADLVSNLNDGSILGSMLMNHSLSDNSYLNLGVLWSFAQEEQEFNQYPRQIYIDYSFYF